MPPSPIAAPDRPPVVARATRRQPFSTRSALLVPIALVGLIVGVVALVTAYGVHDYYRWGDEGIGVWGGRQVETQFPGALWQWSFSIRPLERLTAWEYALADTLAGSTVDGFRLTHAFQGLLWALAAPLVYGLGRRTGLAPITALLAATLAVVGPWLVIPVALLNNAPGFFTFCVLLWAMWHALVRPGWRTDVIVLGAVVLTGMGRFGNAELVAAMVPVAAILAFADARREGDRWLLRFPILLVRRHSLLWAAAAIAALAVVVKGSAGVFGQYGGVRGLSYPWHALDQNVRALTTHVVLAVGVAATILAAAWVAREVLRPRSRETWAFALLAVFVVAAFHYAYAASMNEDRYFVVIAPLAAIGVAHALSDRRPSLTAVLVASIAGGWLLKTSTGLPGGKDTFYISPSTQVWNLPLLGRLSEVPVVGPHASLVASVAAGAVALATAVALRHANGRARMAALGVFVGGVLVYQVVGGVYVMHKWTQLAAPNITSLKAASWIDEDGMSQAVVAIQNPTGDPYRGIALEDQGFWNASVGGSISLSGEPAGACCRGPNTPLRADLRDGSLSPAIAPARLVTSTEPEAGFAGRIVRRSTAWPLRLEVPRTPLRLTYLAMPTRRGEALRVRTFPRAVGRRSCLMGSRGPGASPDGSWTWRVGRRSIPLSMGAFSVQLPDAVHATVRLVGARAPRTPASPRGVPLVSDLRVERCS
jgi:hypothetical protein